MRVGVKELFYLPNLISLSRLVLVFPAAYLIKINTERGNQLLILLAVLIILSDFVDGYASRRLRQVTDLGKLLDPIIDKLCMLVALLSLTFYRGFPVSLPIFLITRDFLIVIISLIIMRKSHKAVMANFWGKLNTLLVSLTMFLFLIGVQNGLFKIGFYTSHITILGSGLSYFAFAESILFSSRRNRILFRVTISLLTLVMVYFAFAL